MVLPQIVLPLRSGLGLFPGSLSTSNYFGGVPGKSGAAISVVQFVPSIRRFVRLSVRLIGIFKSLAAEARIFSGKTPKQEEHNEQQAFFIRAAGAVRLRQCPILSKFFPQ